MADGSQGTISNKPKPRIAFSGEEFGFGYLAADQFLMQAAKFGDADGGYSVSRKTTNIAEIDQRPRLPNFDFSDHTIQRLPLRSKEQALLAVKSNTADFALVPFYSPYSGYDFETMRAIANLFTLMAVDQVDAADQYCLAVYEPQVLDLVQSSHPGSALSSLMSRRRSSWGNPEQVQTRMDVGAVDRSLRADLKIDQAGQMLLRDRIDMVFCGPDAARRCKSKLDGLRAAGVDVAETLRTVEPHREMARLARKTLDRNRQVSTFFNPADPSGVPNYVSTMSSDRHDAPLYGAILPFQVAMMSPDFTIIDDDLEDQTPKKTRFFVVRQVPDETLYEDALRTTDAKTRYWMQRLRDVKADAQRRYGEDSLGGADSNPGVRLMLKFKRSGSAASIGDVESHLRNYGVRHAVTRVDEDSGEGQPAAIILDMEFSFEDFDDDIAYQPLIGFAKWGGVLTIFALMVFFLGAVLETNLLARPLAALAREPFTVGLTALTGLLGTIFWLSRFRRTRGSVVNGAVKAAHARWKDRGVTVVAAMPFENPQLPKHARRRWYVEAPVVWAKDFAQTMQIRLTRVFMPIFLIALFIGVPFLVWYFDLFKF